MERSNLYGLVTLASDINTLTEHWVENMSQLIKQMILKLASGTAEDKEQAKQVLKRAIELKSAKLLGEALKLKTNNLEGKLEVLLMRFDEDANNVGAYGFYDFPSILSLVKRGNIKQAISTISSGYSTRNGGESMHLEPLLQDLEDEMEMLLHLGEGFAMADESYESDECALFTVSGTNVTAAACDSEGVPDETADHNPDYDQVARRVSKALSIQRPRGHQAMVSAVQRIARSVLGRDICVFVNYNDTSY